MKKFQWLSSLLTALVVTAAACFGAQEEEEGFVSLFNGKDLSGWVQKGGTAFYRVEDGMIIGECNPECGSNSFMCTEQEFGNFIFKCEYKVDVPGNSGVQFRSHCRPEGDRSRVFGYQYEIDPSTPSSDTGRIYDEGRRGHQHGIVWLNDVDPEARAAADKSYKPGEWNSIEIQCVGPSIRTWLNGNEVTNTFDYVDMSGFFGLQIHAGKQGKICWKNIRIKDLGTSEWKSFFVKNDNGQWEIVDAYKVVPECWSFTEKDGREVLWGHHTHDEQRDGLIVSFHNYDNFVARVSYMINGGNSALYFRAEEVKTPWLLRGYQNEISGDSNEAHIWHTSGTPSDPPGRGWIAKEGEKPSSEFVEKIRNNLGWNVIATVALDDHLMTFLNGYKIVDMHDPIGEKTGKLGLQLHGSANVDMWFYDFQVIEITPEMKALIKR
ncbi:MAG: 3-keto-disaccharide hydrolase [Thermoguttaceae bacterium]|jgi:hypothetical protein